MKTTFISEMFSVPKNNAEAQNAEAKEESPVKYFAVVHGDQGRMNIIIRDSHKELADLLQIHCKNPQEIEAMGTCNKFGVIDMTNPEKFSRKWLDGKIRSRQTTLKDLFFRPKKTVSEQQKS
jgi:Ni,Fe-hydrogenase I small subunit